LANIDESTEQGFSYWIMGCGTGAAARRICSTCYHDPMERENVAADAGYQEILLDMESKVLAWMVETNDSVACA
jgi:hypothetical protein